MRTLRLTVDTEEVVPIFPMRNSTKPKPTPTDSDRCEAACTVYYPEITALSWVPEYQVVYTTEITVGTVNVVIMTNGNMTLGSVTETVYGYVPSEYNLYMRTTDADGTAAVDVPITLSDGNIFFSHHAYPTPYLDYSTEYHWEGVLPTHNKEFSPVCATATAEAANAILPKHPEYPQPKEVFPSTEDPLGAEHIPLWVSVADEPDKDFFDVAFPSESAFTYCKSQSGKPPVTTQFSAPKFLYETTTIYTEPWSKGFVHDESTATGFDEQTTTRTRHISFKSPHLESTADGWEETPAETPTGVPDSQPQIPHFQSTATGFEPPDAHQTANPPADIPNAIASIINNNPGIFTPPANRPNTVARPAVATPAPAPANPTPRFTLVPTVVGGQTTTVPAFILPDSDAVATIGQEVTINGQATVLAAPPAVFTEVPTTINGVPTMSPAFIISGTSTASIGQTVTLNGQPTVLAVPLLVFTIVTTVINGMTTTIAAYVSPSQPTIPAAQTPVLTMIATTINGVATSVPVYIISGSITATPGQTVTLNGQATVLPAATPVLTSITTTINGTPTVVPAYIISGSITATIGQTVTIGGKTTVLSGPTSTESIDTRFGGPAATSTGQPQATGSGDSPGVGTLRSSVSWGAACVGLGALVIMWL